MGVCDHLIVGSLLDHTELELVTLNFKCLKKRTKNVNLLMLL